MMEKAHIRQAREVSAEAAAAMVKSGDWIDYGFGMAQPDAFDKALAARRDELVQVKLRNCLTMRSRAIIEADPEGEHFLCFNWHFTGYDRKKHDAGLANYIPMNFGEAPDLYRRFVPPVDMVILKCAPIDGDGWFNFGGGTTYLRAIVERAKVVVVEVNPNTPYVFGPKNGVHISEVDYVIPGDGQPIPEMPNPPASEVDHKVARFIAAEITDGACLQIGIGGMPNAVCASLTDAGVRDLGIHTEMMTDGIVALYDAGMVTGARKSIDKGKMAFTFAAGSKHQYDAITRNPDFIAHPVDYTNLPHNIMQNDNVVSINNTTQIDLSGQAASETDGHRQLTGTGGQLQFVRGAYASKGGKSFICLASTYDKKGERRSRIVPELTLGNVATTPRTDTMFVVTEYGMVNLKGKSVAERALSLISIAHPDFRESLERGARARNLIPRGFPC
jgi:acyl-CoA hydrolase